LTIAVMSICGYCITLGISLFFRDPLEEKTFVHGLFFHQEVI